MGGGFAPALALAVLAAVGSAAALEDGAAEAPKSARSAEAWAARVEGRREDRRLFSFGNTADLASVTDAANAWADEASEKAGGLVDATADAATDAVDAVGQAFTDMKASFAKAEGTLQQIRAVAEAALAASVSVGGAIDDCYSSFGEVQRYFRTPWGVVPLLTDAELMQQLIGIVGNLLNTTSEVQGIGEACEVISMATETISEQMAKWLQQLKGLHGRRLLGDIPKLEVDLGDFTANFDYSDLLSGLDFSKIQATMGAFAGQAGEIGTWLEGSGATLQPILDALDSVYSRERSNEARWRLPTDLKQEDVREIGSDRVKYEDALAGIPAEWTRAENLTREACLEVRTTVRDVESLVCRLTNFFAGDAFPGQKAVHQMVHQCDSAANRLDILQRHCPAVQSKGIKDGISSSSGFVSFVFATTEYAVMNQGPLGYQLGALLVVLGVLFAFMGYYLKNFFEFCQGFGCCATGCPLILLLLIERFDMCKGGFIPDCDKTVIYIILVNILALSVLCGAMFYRMDWEKTEAFLSTFSAGSALAGIFYLNLFREEFLAGFLEPDSAKPYLTALAIFSVVIGLVVGVATVYLELFRHIVMAATTAIGACMMIFGVMCSVSPHWWSQSDAVAWAVLSASGYLVQWCLLDKLCGKSSATPTEDVGSCAAASGDAEEPLVDKSSKE